MILNASTTGYFGLFSLVATLPLIVLFRRRARLQADSGIKIVFKAAAIGGIVLVVAVVVAYAAFGFSLAEYVLQSHAAKVTDQAGSGAFRFYSLMYSLEEVFVQSPIIGVGYGSHRSLTLISYLLSNVGIVGALAFLMFNAVIFFHAVKVMNRTENPTLASFAFALAWTHIALLGTMFVGKSVVSFAFGWLWLVMAMSEGCYRIHRSRVRRAAHALA
jgi:O-antigen ligase